MIYNEAHPLRIFMVIHVTLKSVNFTLSNNEEDPRVYFDYLYAVYIIHFNLFRLLTLDKEFNHVILSTRNIIMLFSTTPVTTDNFITSSFNNSYDIIYKCIFKKHIQTRSNSNSAFYLPLLIQAELKVHTKNGRQRVAATTKLTLFKMVKLQHY